jgi:hypothetical protein
MRKKMKFAALSFVVLFQLFSTELNAQIKYNPGEVQVWKEGSVVLLSGDTIAGSIAYHCREDVVEITKEDLSISTFSAVNVDHFTVINDYTGKEQLFRTLYWDQGKENTDFKKPSFFEQLNEGNFTLIIREEYVQRNTGTASATGPYGKEYDIRSSTNGYFVNEVKPLYYILMPDGDIVKLKRTRKDFLDLCGKKSRQVKRYAQKNKLSFETPNELTAIVNFYNTL